MKASETNPLPFNVFFNDGRRIEIVASSPEKASNIAMKRRDKEEGFAGHITKVKLVRKVGK